MVCKGAREWRNVLELLKLGLNFSHYLQLKANNFVKSFIIFNSELSQHLHTPRRRGW